MDHSIKNIVANISGLDEKSLVVDVGGYLGAFSDAVIERWNCWIDVYEPHLEYARKLGIKYKDNVQITIRPIGILDKDENKEIYVRDDATSVFEELVLIPTLKVIAKFESASERFKYNSMIDLLALNCEGSEYAIIEDLCNSGIIKNVKQLLVQYHAIAKSDELIKECEEMLFQTHGTVWTRGPYIWTLYKRK